MFFRKKRAQTISEYVILITIVVAFAVSMFTYVKRGTQGLIQVTADQIGSHYKADQDFNGLGGFITESNVLSSTVVGHERRVLPGLDLKVIMERTDTQTNTTANLGFMEN